MIKKISKNKILLLSIMILSLLGLASFILIKGPIPFDLDNPLTISVIKEIRIPKAITAILAGASLAASGLLMQTFFQNPLAGPFVLGIQSGSSLGVAFWVLGIKWLPWPIIEKFPFFEKLGLTLSSMLGCFLYSLLFLKFKNFWKTYPPHFRTYFRLYRSGIINIMSLPSRR